jgi:hypothetical protein
MDSDRKESSSLPALTKPSKLMWPSGISAQFRGSLLV